MGRIAALAMFAVIGAGVLAVGLWRRRTFLRQDKTRGLVEAQRHTKMRITKRSSGGRGEYKISGFFCGITPRNLIDRTIIIDLGSSVEIATGVRLLLSNGKRPLRIDEKTGCKIHLHRQLAALMLPYPARDESGWAQDLPIMQSGLYGIENIALFSVRLVANSIARVEVDSITAGTSAAKISCKVLTE